MLPPFSQLEISIDEDSSETELKKNTTRVQALTLCFSRETVSVVNNLGLSADDRNGVNAIISEIKRHVDGHINESMEHHRLRCRVQQPGDSFDDYLVSLQELAKT